MPTSLFLSLFDKRLGENNRTEDFFTEAFAWILRHDTVLQFAVLNTLWPLAGFSIEHRVTVQTQKKYHPLAKFGHETESIVDLEINQDINGLRKRLIIESKVESSQHTFQLRRYAEHLAEDTSVDEGYLLFLTKYREEADLNDIYRNIEPSRVKVQFTQRRWHDVYCILKRQGKTSPLPINDLLTFMEHYSMTMPITFHPSIIHTMNTMKDSTDLMSKILNEIRGQLAERIGRPAKESARSTQLVRYNRFIDMVSFAHQFNFGIGFFMQPESDYPFVGIILETGPANPLRSEVQRFLSMLGQKGEKWHVWDGDWAGAMYGESLQHFLAEPDSVGEVTKYLRSLMEEFCLVMNAHPQLGWKAVEPQGAEE